MSWTVETLSAVVDEELEALPPDMRARFAQIAFLIESVRLEKVKELLFLNRIILNTMKRQLSIL